MRPQRLPTTGTGMFIRLPPRPVRPLYSLLLRANSPGGIIGPDRLSPGQGHLSVSSEHRGPSCSKAGYQPLNGYKRLPTGPA